MADGDNRVIPIRRGGALEGMIATDAADGSGALFFGSNHATPPEPVFAGLMAAGIPSEWGPSVKKPMVLLKRALVKAARGYRITKVKATGDLWIVRDTEVDGKPSSLLVGWVRIEGAELAMADTVPAALALGIRESWAASRMLSGADVGAWVIDFILYRMDGVGLKQRGGLYYVREEKLPLLNALLVALEASGQIADKVTVKRRDDILKSVVRGIKAEVDAVAAELARELLKQAEELPAGTESKELGKKSLRATEATLKATREKIARYEAITGPAAQAMLSAFDEVRAKLASATTITRAMLEDRDLIAMAARPLDLDETVKKPRAALTEAEQRAAAIAERPLDLSGDIAEEGEGAGVSEARKRLK